MDELFSMARRHTASGVMLSDPDPFRPIMLSMLIEMLHLLEECRAARGGDAL